MKLLLKQLWYGMFFEYHIKKATKFSDMKTVTNFHYQLALHYYKKIYGREYDAKNQGVRNS
jgi:hypothetical protein